MGLAHASLPPHVLLCTTLTYDYENSIQLRSKVCMPNKRMSI